MSENNSLKPPPAEGKGGGRHEKKAEQRKERQAKALRANLKRRKDQIRQRHTPDGKGV